MRIARGRLIGSLILVASGALAAPALAWAEEVSTTPTVFRAEIRPSTSLHVSRTEFLVDVPSGATAPVNVGSIDFRAVARTRTGGEVVLTVETSLEAQSPAADGDARTLSLEFQGTGSGTMSGVVSSSSPQVVGRWSGSGLRSGTLQFRLEGPLTPGLQRIPLRFVLSAP